MDFRISEEDSRLQRRCRALAADFATRSVEHDRAASHPIENYQRLRDEGFFELNVPKEWGGAGVGLLGHTLAFEALGAGCPSTALAFNMHASVVMPVMDSSEVTTAAKRHLADLVVRQKKLIAGNFSEPGTTSLIGERPLGARARRVDGGYSITGRKMFASMLEAADYCIVMAYPEGATSATAGIMLLVPRDAAGRSVDANWDTLGMRATRSDSQPLAYHPDVRRAVALMSADLEAARLVTYRSAWLSDTEGPTPATTAALYRAKYVVGEAVSRITRSALTLAGAHGIFRGSRLEQLFRDGALAPLQPPPSDFCLFNMGLYELGLDPSDLLPPIKPR